MKRGLIIPVAVTIALAPLFAGCAPSNDDVAADLEAVIVATSPDIEGALAGYSSGASSLRLTIKAYIPTAESMSPEDLAAVVEAGLQAAWLDSPQKPDFVVFGVVPTVKPQDATPIQQDVGRFPETGKILDDDGGTSNGSFGFDGSTLELRFGPRP